MSQTASSSFDHGAVTATLPVGEGPALDADEARRFGESLAGNYRAAQPYPHIVIDNFLPAAFAHRILDLFPGPVAGEKHYEDGYLGLHKREVSPLHCSAEIQRIFHFFNSAPVLPFLEGLSGIEGLLPDPYFDGGGFHEIGAGGKLGIHADFRINERLHLSRRLNLLLYLNRDWDDSYGGHLEIWDRDMRRVHHRIAPLFNRCVVFNTDADSYHGHADPLTPPEGVTRKSVALYYYTASRRIHEEDAALSTVYRARPGDSEATHAEALKLRFMNSLRDWLPPVLFRALSALKRRLRD